jgi:hypothetical protein
MVEYRFMTGKEVQRAYFPINMLSAGIVSILKGGEVLCPKNFVS